MKFRSVSPYDFEFTLRVRREWEGMSLLNLFSNQFSYHTDDEWRSTIEDGRILRNGMRQSPNDKVSAFDLIRHRIPGRVEPDVPDEIQIVYEDIDFLAVFKPAPMPAHPCGRYYKNSLTYILEERGHKKLHLVHRLDMLTSGIVVFAKTVEAAKSLSIAFQNHSVKKTYYAVVDGKFPDSEITAEFPIRRKTSYLFECHPEGKSAKTIFQREKFWTVGTTARSLVKCSPQTGRTHQIRLHLKELQFPIHDDPYYATKEVPRTIQKLYNDSAISLLAQRYCWENRTVEIPLPPHFLGL